MVMIMGTSTCHMVLAKEERAVPGMCGYVEDGILPGFFGYEAGQSCVGDHFGWFVENAVPPAYHEEARARGLDIHALLQEKAARQRVGESGLLALDWWNGNRSVLVDAALGGLLIGATLATTPEEIYRALIEATAYGTRVIIETFEAHGVPIREIVACGGLAEKSPLIMQIYADVTGRPFRLSASDQTPALGSAMFGAVAAGAARWARHDRGRVAGDGPAAGPGLRADPGERGDLRRPLSRVRPAARLLRARRERRDEDPARAARARPLASHGGPDAPRGPPRASSSACTPSCPVTTSSSGPAATSARATRRRARRDQAVRRPLRGPDRRDDGRPRSSTGPSSRATSSPRRTPPATSTSTAIGPTSTASSTRTRATRRPSPPSAGPSRSTSPRRPTSSAARSRAPGSRSSATRASARSSSRASATRRPSCSRTTACSPSARRPWPRSRPRSWSRTSPRRSGPPSRSARPRDPPDDVVAAPPPSLHHRLRPVVQESSVLELSRPTKSGSSPAASTCTARRPSRPSPSTARPIAAALDDAAAIPVRVVVKPVLTDADEIRRPVP